jgi:hypothetical protein
MKLDLAYILQADTPDGLIKIGQSGAPEKRLVQISQSVPFQIRPICILSDGRHTERELKEALRPAKVKGEWYEPDDNLIRFLEKAHAAKRIIERVVVDADYFNEFIAPKISHHLNGREPYQTGGGDLLYRILHGEPLCFVGRETYLVTACDGKVSMADLVGYRPARAFGPVVLNGKRIEMPVSPERAEAIRQGVG